MSNSPLVIGLGELLWDVFPDSRRPGGAPANVAFQASQLGCDGRVASRVGDDPRGREIVTFLEEKQLDTSLIQIDSAHPTGQVTVELTTGGQPDYTIHESVAWDFLEPAEELLAASAQAMAVCFGTLAQRRAVSRETIHQVLRGCRDDCEIVYDVNLRQRWYDVDWIRRSLDAASIVKLNSEEAQVLSPLLGIAASNETDLADRLLETHHLSLVCLTRGAAGCLLVAAEETADVPGEPVDVVDAVGAGDAFTAALITARLEGWPLEATARFANAVGGLVASRAGAMPDLADELAALREAHSR
jgi:fructokinase